MAQWKRKAQKAQGEMNDTKLLLEEQTSRNLLLEKKQRKFDAEINSLQEDRKQEKAAKDKLYRELDDIKRIKYSLEDEITVGQSSFTSRNAAQTKRLPEFIQIQWNARGKQTFLGKKRKRRR